MRNEKKTTRAFICVELSDEAIKEVTRVQNLIGNKIKFIGKLVEPENLHLTLKFLGEIDEEMLDRVKEKLKEIKFDMVEAGLDDVGTFSYGGMPRIVWIKISGKGIFDLQKKIDEALSDLFEKENRFMSHLAIARVKYAKDLRYFFEYLKNLKCKKIKFKVKGFKLMSSELKMTGSVYRIIEEFNSIL